MKNLFKKIFFVLFLAISISSIINTQPTYAFGEANSSSCRTFLGMVAWDCQAKEDPKSEEELTSNAIKIASNLLIDATIISAYLVLGFVIYGGYLYMFSSGDSTKAANSRKVLSRAFIGLAIVLLTNIILNAIRIALIGNDGSFADATTENHITADQLFTNAINWVIGISGLVALIFVIIGAIGYITSAGDSNKLAKAKNTIIQALIGLVIVGLAAVITAFVSNLIRNAGDNNTSYINQTVAAKELYEK